MVKAIDSRFEPFSKEKAEIVTKPKEDIVKLIEENK
jgi:hypothetical protein